MFNFLKKLSELLDTYDNYASLDHRIKILEAGCGEGNISNFLYERYREKGGEIFAFDISNTIIEKAKKRYKHIYFYREDIYNIKADGGKYNLVVCSEVLEHLEHPDKALTQLKGLSYNFIFSVPNEPIWRILNMIRGKYIKSLGNTPGHINHWSVKSLIKLIEGQGFKVVKLKKPLPWIMLECKLGE